MPSKIVAAYRAVVYDGGQRRRGHDVTRRDIRWSKLESMVMDWLLADWPMDTDVALRQGQELCCRAVVVPDEVVVHSRWIGERCNGRQRRSITETLAHGKAEGVVCELAWKVSREWS